MDHPLSLAFLTLPDTPPDEVIEAAGLAGFASVGLRLLPAVPGHEPDYPLLHDREALARTRAAMRATGVTIADVEIVRLGPGFDPASLLPFLDRGAELGARHVLVAGDDPDAARLTDSFARFCVAAAGFGLSGDLEFMPWTAVPDLAAARRIVEAAGQPNGAVLIDALHFDRSATTLEEVRALPARLVNYVQFCDGPAAYDPSPAGLAALARGGRLMPGEGAIDLRGLAAAIPPGVTISVEVADRSNRLGPRETAMRAAQTTRAVLATAVAF